MKQFLPFLVSLCTMFVVTTAKAQLRDTIQPGIQQGNYADFWGTGVGGTASGSPYWQSNVPVAKDTLQVSDTLAAIFNITHTNEVSAFLSWYWQKIGTGTATITATFYTGNDPFNLTPVRKGVLDSAYSKTYTLSASGWNYIDFETDTARISGRYLKVQLMTSSTASVGGRVQARIKTNIR